MMNTGTKVRRDFLIGKSILPGKKAFFQLIFLFGAINFAFCGYSVWFGKVTFSEWMYGSVELSDADASTFQVLRFNNRDTNFAKDRTHVWFFGIELPKADSKNFTLLNETHARDLKNVYFQDETIPGAEPESFVGLSMYYGKDSRHAFRKGRAFEVKDISTFDLAKDLNKSKPNSFFANNEIYSKDQLDYYYNDDVAGLALGVERMDQFHISSAFPDKFGFGSWAEDGVNFFCQGHKVPLLDIGSFKILNSYYSKDKFHVYYLGSMVEGVDVGSFRIVENGDAIIGYDKDNRFWSGKIDNKD